MADVGQHLDLDALKELQQVMGDEFSLLIDTFTSDSVVRIEGIIEAVQSKDPESIRRAAHSFKGSASNMGAIVLTEHCRALEELGHNGETEGSEDLQQKIIDEYEEVKKALSSI